MPDVKLKAGGMGAEQPAESKPTAFAGSMAEAIEEALNALLPAERRFATNDNSKEARDRRLLFVAIAQGVVDHLVAKTSAFVITHESGEALPHKLEIGKE